MQDKRLWQRLDVDLSATSESVLEPREQHSVRVLNVNEKGMCCSLDGLLEPGTRHSLCVDLGPHGQCALVMEVVWAGFFTQHKQSRVGFKIVDSADEDRKTYLKFLNFLLVSGTTLRS